MLLKRTKNSRKLLAVTALSATLLAASLANIVQPLTAQAASASEKVSNEYILKVNSHVRSGIGTNHKILKTLKKGTTIKPVVRKQNKDKVYWYKIKIGSTYGWISGKLLTKKFIYKTSGDKKAISLNVPYINQLKPVYAPFGCEGASLLQALRYKGYAKKTSYKKLLNNMPKTTRNPFKGFAGSPYHSIDGVFQSIFPKPLTKYGKKYSNTVKDISGASVSTLRQELANGNPIVVYVTLNFSKPKWTKWNMGSAGKNVKMVDNLHVMTLAGYSSKTKRYKVIDPNNKGEYWVNKYEFERAYNALKYAVVVR
ncbi:C39 family peptidase [Rummeliibacillus sp. SL167]|uniref:C39 family peptidase n=1 Tax=Rummeliibacillus sp. SL167 TaxID=2579792 RepID=UPI0011B7C640|nr:C39 family peptidase [Rummeliibacillus sp. SL167]